MILEGRVGPATLQDGALREARLGKSGEIAVTDAHGRYHEAAIRGATFSLVLTATTTGVAAGNIVGAAAAATTQFALWNPVSSGRNLVLLKFGMGIISGTPGAGPMFHSLIVSTVPTVASVGTALNNFVNGPAPAAKYVASAAGTAFTGGSALQTLRIADFTSTATAAASVGELKAIEILDGDIVLPPVTGWVPTWGAAGTSLLNGYSITWEEVPV